jgi:hydrogenase maturation protease
MKKTVLIGLGNLLMTDEGVGVRVIQQLQSDPRRPEDVDALDLGPGGLRVLHAMDGADKVVFVDCAFMDAEAGTMQRFLPAEARTVKVRGRQSLHEGDLFETLELAERLGRLPQEVVIFGVQPQLVASGDDLSGTLAARLPGYVDTVLAELVDAPRDSPHA